MTYGIIKDDIRVWPPTVNLCQNPKKGLNAVRNLKLNHYVRFLIAWQPPGCGGVKVDAELELILE